MQASEKTPISFGHGCAVSDDIFCVAAFLDHLNPEYAYTRIYILNLSASTPWMHHDIPGRTIVSIAFRPASHAYPRACYALSDDGLVQIFNSTQVVEESILTVGKAAIRNDGLMFSAIKRIGSTEYVCGNLGRIYQRGEDGWKQVAEPISNMAFQDVQSVIERIGISDADDMSALMTGIGRVVNFEHIAGVSEKDLYACANNGMIFHWDGESWQSLNSPTRQHLHHIHCTSPDEVYMCGHNGTLLVGNAKAGFHPIVLGKNGLNFWTTYKFGDIAYVGTTSGLFQVEKHTLQPVDLGLNTSLSDFTVQALDATERVLWVVTDKFLLRLENGMWEKIDHPDNALQSSRPVVPLLHPEANFSDVAIASLKPMHGSGQDAGHVDDVSFRKRNRE